MANNVDNSLGHAGADVVKKICRHWGGASSLGKADALRYLSKAIVDPELVKKALDKLGQGGIMSASLLKVLGSYFPPNLITAAAITAFSNTAEPEASVAAAIANIEKAVSAGLIVQRSYGYSIVYSLYASRNNSTSTFIHPSLIDYIPASIAPVRFQISELAAPSGASVLKRSLQSVTLDIVSAMKAVDSAGPLREKVSDSEFRLPDVNRIAKAAGWKTAQQSNGLSLPNPEYFYLYSLSEARMIVPLDDGNYSPNSSEIVDLSGMELVRRFFNGFAKNWQWTAGDSDSRPTTYEREMRVALFMGLACLPHTFGFFSFDQFERALFDRIGHMLSVRGYRFDNRIYSPFGMRETVPEEERQQRFRDNWVNHDIPRLHCALTTWAYRLGFVELILQDTTSSESIAEPRVALFRATDLLRALVTGSPAASADELNRARAGAPADTKNTNPWIVQPNFDVVLFLNEADTTDLNFLEQIAQRCSVSDVIANYRITKESISHGLRHFGDSDAIIRALAARSRTSLPTNVVQEISSWTASISRVNTYRNVDIIEFESQSERDAYLHTIKTKSNYTLIGDRFLAVAAAIRPMIRKMMFNGRFSYMSNSAFARVGSFESGTVKLHMKHMDFRQASILNRWSVQPEDRGQAHDLRREWLLTRESVIGVLKTGRTPAELYSALNIEEWSLRFEPKGLSAKLAIWTQSIHPAVTEETVLFTFHDVSLVASLTTLAAINNLIIGQPKSNSLVVRRENAAAVTKELEKLGITVEPPSASKAPRK